MWFFLTFGWGVVGIFNVVHSLVVSSASLLHVLLLANVGQWWRDGQRSHPKMIVSDSSAWLLQEFWMYK